MSIYDGIESMLLRRGEKLFPFCAFEPRIDVEAVRRAVDVIPLDGERFMTSEEILRLYE
jgi:hypothetical protein